MVTVGAEIVETGGLAITSRRAGSGSPSEIIALMNDLADIRVIAGTRTHEKHTGKVIHNGIKAEQAPPAN
jgi:hypothetical protein